MSEVPQRHLPRNRPRIPFFAPVAATGLRRCWATNLSTGGIGLSALGDGDAPLGRDREIQLEFVLGRSKRPFRASGRVAWCSSVRPDGRFGLGVEFNEICPADRARLARFIADHRPRVVVALASALQKQLAGKALGHLDVEHIDSPAELGHDTMRSCASIVVFCNDPGKMTRFLEAVATHYADAALIPAETPLAPITLCTSIDSELLLPYFREGRIYEVLRPPLDPATLALAAARSCERSALQLELSWASLQLEATIPRQTTPYLSHAPELPRGGPTIIRVSESMLQVCELIQTVAVHDVPVLLLGETGTGKELAAREVHALSRRANTPFVAQDCGALTETLLESELFGHVKGAFTGAVSDHPGLFQIADGGTIFLDEIQNTTPALQAKLLRVVEEGEIRPVGSAKIRQVDVRLIAACNLDLRTEVKERRFRADFFYRLNRFPIELPPLRERPACILPLARYFVAVLSKSLARPHAPLTGPLAGRLDPRVESALVAYDWPGNVRELKNAIERAILLTPAGEPLRWEALPDEVRGGKHGADPDVPLGLDHQMEEFARRIITRALERHEGVIRRAASELEVNAVTLSRKMRKLGIG